jgi:hypothetical protein
MKPTVSFLAASLLAPFAIHADAHATQAKQPNVLLIITDDQGYGDFSIHGNAHLQTPNIDKLGRESVRFDRFYVDSFCAPTRAALLTGRWPLRTGVHGVTRNAETMRTSEVTLAEALGGGGYRSACFGKWHNGEQYPFTPMGQGFDEAFGFNNGHWNNYFDPVLLRGSQPQQAKGYITDVLTDEAMRFITGTAAGNWVKIDPKRDGGRGFRDYFDENNGWTYAWLVQHDILGLMALLGGPAAMVARLDQLFREPLGMHKSVFLADGCNSTGMVGQFSMGNELSFHIPFLYNYAGAPWKTQPRIRFLLDVWFKDNLFGAPGDGHGGSMGSWVVLASIGLYQVTPGVPVFTLTSPIFTEVTIDLPGARVFKISAPAASKRRKYIQATSLNGQPLSGPFITYRQIMAGGELTFELGEKPNREWGTGGFPASSTATAS